MRASALLAGAMTFALTAPAVAQTLPTLRVLSFTLAADTAAPQQERPFHLTIEVRTAGRVGDIQGVVLPPFGPLEILGDEKHTVAGNGTSTYRETITVVAHRSGAVTVAPAYLDAIDARDHKPKRFLSNALTLAVGGPAVALRDADARAGGFLRTALALALGALVVVALALAALRMRRPPPLVASVEPSPAVPDPPGPPDVGTAVAAARDTLAREPSRDGALAARKRVWEAVGAGEGETLADVVRRPAAHDPSLRAVLRALERAAFTGDADRAAAIDAALIALGDYRP